MSAPFGFSVGDILAGLKLIKKSVEALQDTKGSAADYQALIYDINSLEDRLAAVNDLRLDQRFGPKSKQNLAVQEAISRCWNCVDAFLSAIAKYQPWLQGNTPAGFGWKANLKKIQWALCKKDDVNRFRAQLERHSASISMLLVTLQVSHSFEQSAQQECQHQLATESNGKAIDLQRNIGQTTALLLSLNLEQRQMFQSLVESNRRLVASNERMTYELQQMRCAVQLQLELPPQVVLQKPVTLLDACGKVSAFHLDFITCPEALLAVLRIRFQQHGVTEDALQMLDDSQFVLKDHGGQLDLSKPWSQVLRPNQKIDMSMVFRRDKSSSACPVCQWHNEDRTEAEIECQSCGLYFHCVQERLVRSSGPEEMTNADIKASGLDLSRDNIFITNDRDNGGLINQFRRVQLLNLQVQVDDSAKTFARSSEGTKYKTSWTRAEKQRFRKVLGITGTDWVALSNRLSTKSPDQLESYYAYCCHENIPGIESRAQTANHLRKRSNRATGTSRHHLFDMSAALLARMKAYDDG